MKSTDLLEAQALLSPEVEELIKLYDLQPHIEGGYFREDFKSEQTLSTPQGTRSFLTTCYYLLTEGSRSIFHKLTSDEIWNFCLGGPVDLYEIDETGRLTVTTMSQDIRKGHTFKHLVKCNTWFGAVPQKGTDFAFFACYVYPGFEFTDWEQGDPEILKALCPSASDIIDRLT